MDLRQSPELCSDNSAGAAGDAEMQESEPVFTYQSLEVFPKLSSKLRKYAKVNRAWDKLKHCCKAFKKFKMSLPSRKVWFRKVYISRTTCGVKPFMATFPYSFMGPGFHPWLLKSNNQHPELCSNIKKEQIFHKHKYNSCYGQPDKLNGLSN